MAAQVGQTYPHVDNREGGLWDDGAVWRLELELRLGALGGGGVEEFGEIAAIAVDPQQRIYVLDFLSQEVRVFDEDGGAVRVIGGPGEGPGEFGRARGLVIGPENSLWVIDVDPPRLSVFDSAGIYRESYRRDAVGSVIPWPGRVLQNGALMDWSLEWPLPSEGGTGRWATLSPMLVDSVGSWVEYPALEINDMVVLGGRPSTQSRKLVVAAGRDSRLWFARTDEYRVFERSLSGDTLRSFSRPIRPQSVDVDSVVRAYSTAGYRLGRAEVPRFHPVVERIVTDDAGHILVIPRERGVRRSTSIDVFLESGRYLGQLKLPVPILTSPAPVVTARHIYAVVVDDLDVPYVVRWRIIGRAAARSP